MISTIQLSDKNIRCDFSKPIDISIPLQVGMDSPNCFYAPFLEITPFVAGDFVGSTEAGSPVNFMNVKLNPHGNGTHTECVGHISKEKYTINQCLQQFIFEAELISVFPEKMENGDRVIGKHQLEQILDQRLPKALIIRTLPNDSSKMRRQYSGSNPPFFSPAAIQLLVGRGLEHLLVDLPSIDKEADGGVLAAHKAFWKYPHNTRVNCTITELIFIKNSIPDGKYLLNIQITALEMDASPSKPILYQVI